MGPVCTTANLGDVAFNKEYADFNQEKNDRDVSDHIPGFDVTFREGLERGCVQVPPPSESGTNHILVIILSSLGVVVLLTAIVLGLYCYKKKQIVEDDDRMDSMIYNKNRKTP